VGFVDRHAAKNEIDHSPFVNLKSSEIKQAIFIEPVLTPK
jgi:hypothetical protein